jgi:hypothetical protein
VKFHLLGHCLHKEIKVAYSLSLLISWEYISLYSSAIIFRNLENLFSLRKVSTIPSLTLNHSFFNTEWQRITLLCHLYGISSRNVDREIEDLQDNSRVRDICLYMLGLTHLKYQINCSRLTTSRNSDSKSDGYCA